MLLFIPWVVRWIYVLYCWVEHESIWFDAIFECTIFCCTLHDFLSLQVHFSSGGVKLLALAEALLKKHINSHSLHEPEGISDFLMPFAILVILLFFHTLMWFFPDMFGLCGSTFSLCFNFGATGKIWCCFGSSFWRLGVSSGKGGGQASFAGNLNQFSWTTPCCIWLIQATSFN